VPFQRERHERQNDHLEGLGDENAGDFRADEAALAEGRDVQTAKNTERTFESGGN
jgi:hypothetical protein